MKTLKEARHYIGRGLNLVSLNLEIPKQSEFDEYLVPLSFVISVPDCLETFRGKVQSTFHRQSTERKSVKVSSKEALRAHQDAAALTLAQIKLCLFCMIS